MSDEIKFDQVIANAMNTQQSEPAEPPTPEPAPVKTTVITAQTIQTADNTLAAEILPPKAQHKGEWDPETVESNHQLFIHGFIGLNRKSHERISKELDMWTEYTGAKLVAGMTDAQKRKEGIEESAVQARIAEWEEYCAVNMPGKSMDEINERQRSIYGYLNNIADALLLQYPVVREPGLTNVMQRTTKEATGDLVGLVPDVARKKLGIGEFMRRTALSKGNEPYMYDLLLRNSYVAFRYVKPTKLEQGVLIRDISMAVRHHVRQVSQNVPAIANIAVMRVIWKFICARIRQTSVKDTQDFDELADVIRITDMNVMAQSLLEVAYPRGVNFNLSCLARSDCDWSAKRIIDPSSLLIDRKWLDTKEESAAYANMLNSSRKYSREESLKLQKQTNYQHDIEPIWNSDRSACFILGVPSLTESFEAEEFYAEMVRSKLDEIREQSMNEEQYNAKRDDFLNGLIGTDYLHYIAEYHVMPAEGTDGTPVIIKRSEEDASEFNQGLVNIIGDNDEMGIALISAVVKHYPFMSKTFVGLANYQCEKCKHESETFADLGYTPINVISTFFTLASLMLTGRSRVGESVQHEALLGITQ